jgi:hypothetical protein
MLHENGTAQLKNSSLIADQEASGSYITMLLVRKIQLYWLLATLFMKQTQHYRTLHTVGVCSAINH